MFACELPSALGMPLGGGGGRVAAAQATTGLSAAMPCPAWAWPVS